MSAAKHELPVPVAHGVSVFAGIMLILGGGFEALQAIAAIVNDKYLVVLPNYVYAFDLTTWGWIHLLIGLVMLAVGFGLYAGALWAVIGGLAIAMLSALSNFFFIPYYPIWALLLIVLDVWIIWSLTRPGAIRT